MFSIMWPEVILGKWNIVLKNFKINLKAHKFVLLRLFPDSNMAAISFFRDIITDFSSMMFSFTMLASFIFVVACFLENVESA